LSVSRCASTPNGLIAGQETDHSKRVSSAYFTRTLNRLLGTENASLQMLRKLYISRMLSESSDVSVIERLQLARESGHALLTQLDYGRLAPLMATATDYDTERKDSAH